MAQVLFNIIKWIGFDLMYLKTAYKFNNMTHTKNHLSPHPPLLSPLAIIISIMSIGSHIIPSKTTRKFLIQLASCQILPTQTSHRSLP